MPRAKKISPAKKNISRRSQQTKQDEQALLEFEDFITQKPKNDSRHRIWLASFLLIIIILLSSLFIYNWQSPRTVPEQKFKAIYLENGEVYYAKIAREDALSVYLDEVYYIQMQEQLVPLDEEGLETETISVPILLKRGSELHQPVGWMQVNRSKVIAIEEIGGDSEILKEINRQKNQ